MGLPLPLATCLSWVGPPSNLGGGECARCVPSSQSLFIGKIYGKSTNGTCHGVYIISMADGISKKFEIFSNFTGTEI